MLVTTALPSLTATLYSKKWNTNGFEAVYTIQIMTAATKVDYLSRFYVEFSANVGAGVNKYNIPECYFRTDLSALPLSPSGVLFRAFCKWIDQNRLLIHSNIKVLPTV